jgi:acyl-CoA synthetase (AMP-forming)/AMP-acid ligase II
MNLTMLLDMAAEGFGDRVVVGSRAGGLTAGRLRELAMGGARAIRDAGSDAVVYLAVNGPAFQVALFAAAYAGVPLVPVNYRLGEEQIDQLLANHPRAYAVVESQEAGVVARAGLDSRTPDEWLATAAAAAGTDIEPVITDAPAVIIYTSGTTSAPKGVLLRQENLVSYVFGTVEFMSADADDAALMSVPPYHIAAVSNALTNLFAGRRVLVLENFSPAGWLELVRAEGITNAMVVPTMLARIMDADGLDLSVPTLRSLAYGGAKMPRRVIERALREWPHVDFVNAYGLTETSSTTAPPSMTQIPRCAPVWRPPAGRCPVSRWRSATSTARSCRREPPVRSGSRGTRCPGSTPVPGPWSTRADSSSPVTRDDWITTGTSSSRGAWTTPSSAAPRTSPRRRSRTS